MFQSTDQSDYYEYEGKRIHLKGIDPAILEQSSRRAAAQILKSQKDSVLERIKSNVNLRRTNILLKKLRADPFQGLAKKQLQNSYIQYQLNQQEPQPIKKTIYESNKVLLGPCISEQVMKKLFKKSQVCSEPAIFPNSEDIFQDEPIYRNKLPLKLVQQQDKIADGHAEFRIKQRTTPRQAQPVEQQVGFAKLRRRNNQGQMYYQQAFQEETLSLQQLRLLKNTETVQRRARKRKQDIEGQVQKIKALINK